MLTLSNEIEKLVSNTISKWQTENVLQRMWECDPTVWKPKKEDDVELSNRLGWLNLPTSMEGEVADLRKFCKRS